MERRPAARPNKKRGPDKIVVVKKDQVTFLGQIGMGLDRRPLLACRHEQTCTRVDVPAMAKCNNCEQRMPRHTSPIMKLKWAPGTLSFVGIKVWLVTFREHLC